MINSENLCTFHNHFVVYCRDWCSKNEIGILVYYAYDLNNASFEQYFPKTRLNFRLNDILHSLVFDKKCSFRIIHIVNQNTSHIFVVGLKDLTWFQFLIFITRDHIVRL